jgi:error-prone DNA polymerase
MQLAIVAAGFTPGEADRLRRAMAAWKRKGGLGPFEQRLVEGMRARGYDEGFARQVFQQILGFGDYGFPEAHAASFALLVYVSAWLKRHEPRPSAARSSTASRWVSTRRRSRARRARMGSRC